MPLTAGTKLGPYEITALIGAGGMGEVYRSRDSKLKRDVAIKVLPAEFSRDPERTRRFRREAEVLATLNHPHIAQIYGLEESGETLCLVLELAEGETLADRLRHGPLPVDDALRFASQIAEALEAAHERGIVHRDLKPANIKITPEGQVKVLDFGLAKAMDPGGPETAMSQSPTMLSGTMPGVILGTAAYMSPEQAKGRQADARSDVWAFGCVLYEMLTGKPIFAGETTVEILGEILKAEPGWSALPTAASPPIRSLLRRCLQKDRNRRMRDMADARFQIEEALTEPAGLPVIQAPLRKSRERVWWIAAMLVIIAAWVVNVVYERKTPTGGPQMRLQIVSPPGASLGSFAISPDGHTLAFQAAVAGKSQLWLRPLDSETAQPLAGTDNGTRPFWSPDSQSLGFFATGQLERIDIATGLVQTLASAPVGNGGSWSRDGIIVFSKSSTGPLYRVRAGGGEVVEATRVAPPAEAGHRYPYFLPDGRHFLFFALGTPERRGVYVGSLDSMETRRLFDAESGVVFAPPSHVLFARRGTLSAQRLDLKTLEPVGDPVPVAGRVVLDSVGYFDIALSASEAGLIAYQGSPAVRQLVWLDRSGRQVGSVGGLDAAQPQSTIRLSPDGQTVGLSRIVDGNRDVWLIDSARGVLRRFTSDAAIDTEPAFSPDGQRVAFSSLRKGLPDVYERVNGGAERVLLESSEFKNLYDWSPDGSFLLYSSQTPQAGRDLWALPLVGDQKPIAVTQTPFEESNGRFSPDSHWVAYQSTETGRNEIYVQPFPGPGPKLPVSNGGGTFPKWRRDGRELFYIGSENRVMAAQIMLSGQTAQVGASAPLFSIQRDASYAPSPDGNRFLVNTVVEDPSPITVLVNWQPPQ